MTPAVAFWQANRRRLRATRYTPGRGFYVTFYSPCWWRHRPWWKPWHFARMENATSFSLPGVSFVHLRAVAWTANPL